MADQYVDRGRRRGRTPVFPGVMLAGLCLSAALPAGDWPRWRGSNFDGISTESGWRTQWPEAGPPRVWQASVGIGYSSVSVSGGKLYTMGNTDDVDAVYCFDAENGKALWKHTYACEAKDPNGYHGTRATPTVADGRVYSLSRHGHLFCLDGATGAVLWAKDFKKDYGAEVPRWGYSGSPLVEGNLLVTEVGGDGRSVVAFDKVTGVERWRAGNDTAAYSSIIPYLRDGERELAVLTALGIVGRSPADGAELWRHEWKTRYDVNAATPIVDQGRVFLSSGYGKGCGLIDFKSGVTRAVWENTNMRNHVGTCVLWEGHLYGFDERELKCLDLKTGEEKWAERKYGKGSILRAGNAWILYSDNGYVATAEVTPAGCRELSGFQVLKGKDTWAIPVLANGLLYCRSLEELVCLDVRQ